jgi:hypothetical protein
LLQNHEKQVATLGRAQQRLASVTTAGDEMEISGPVVTMETPRNRRRLDDGGPVHSDLEHDENVMKA